MPVELLQRYSISVSRTKILLYIAVSVKFFYSHTNLYIVHIYVPYPVYFINILPENVKFLPFAGATENIFKYKRQISEGRGKVPFSFCVLLES